MISGEILSEVYVQTPKQCVLTLLLKSSIKICGNSSVFWVTVKSDDLVTVGAVICSQMLSSSLYGSGEECVFSQ